MALYPKWLWAVVLALLVVHFNYWMWDDARVLAGVPVNLVYHVIFSASLSLVMLAVVRRAWPRYLSDD